MLLDPNVPWQVRDNVEGFLRQIDEREGYARFGLSIISDSNPRNITSQREFTIGGFRLTFVPPADNKRVTGVRYAAQAMRPIERDAGLSAYVSATYLDYPNITFDRLTADLGLAKQFGPSKRAAIRAGLEGGTFGGKRLYEFPYIGFGYALAQSPLYRVTSEARVGRVNFADFDFLEARYQSAGLSAMRVLGDRFTAGVTTLAERSDTHDKAFSYMGVSVAPAISWLVTRPTALLLRGELAFGKRDYGAEDPFFGLKRSDRKTRLDVSVRSKEWRFFNFSPALVLSLEHNDSSIDFYQYDKVNVSIALE